MMRPALHAMVGVLLVPAIAAAAPVLTLDAPQAIVPGESFDLTVRLVGADDLALYNVELLLSSTSGTPGVDYAYVGAAAPVAGYVFNGAAGDGFAYAVLASRPERMTLSDLLLGGGVTTVADVNDVIATVTISTAASMTGDLTIGVLAGSLELDTSTGGVIDGWDGIVADPPQRRVTVPEPSGLLLLLIAAGVSMRRRRRLS